MILLLVGRGVPYNSFQTLGFKTSILVFSTGEFSLSHAKYLKYNQFIKKEKMLLFATYESIEVVF